MAEATLQELMTAVNSMREKNDRRLTELEKNGVVSGETTAAVEAANTHITALQAQLADERDQTETKMAELEDRINRNNTGQRGHVIDDETRERYAVWQGGIQNKSVDPADVDLEFVQGYARGFKDYLKTGRVANEMSVVSDPDGGFWLDPDTSGRMATMIYETSPMRQFASAQAITGEALEGDVDLDEAAVGGWVGELEARTGNTDTPNIGTWRIPVNEQYAEPRTTQKALDMLPNVDAWLTGKLRDKFSRTENTAFVSGNGNKKPRGYVTYTAGTATAANWQLVQQVNTGHATLLLSDGIVDLVFALKSGYRMGSIFAMERLTQAAVRKLVDGQGNYLWQPDFTKTANGLLLGFPVAEFDDMATIAANALPIAFGNFGVAYQIVDGMGMRVLRDPFTTKGKVKFYTTKFAGGDLINFEAIKLQKVSA